MSWFCTLIQRGNRRVSFGSMLLFKRNFHDEQMAVGFDISNAPIGCGQAVGD